MPARVLIYIPDLQMGGAEANVVMLATRLDRSQFEPVVGWAGTWGMAGDQLNARSIPLFNMKLRTGKPDDAVQAFREVRPDVYLSFAYRSAYQDVEAARRAGIDAIVTTRSNMRHWDPDMEATTADDRRNKVTRLVVACCHAVAQVCTQVERVPMSRIVVAHNGVDVPPAPAVPRAQSTIREELGIPPHVRLLGLTANYRPLKGHATLLRAMQRVIALEPHTHLVTCGTDVEPGHRAELQALVETLHLERHVSLLPERSDLTPVYGGLDLFVQASTTEGLSNSLLEAMSWGLPVVATNVGGTAEAVVDSVCGRLIPHSDPDAMAAAILEVFCHREHAARWGANARQRVIDRFTRSHMVAGYEAALLRALGDHHDEH